MQITYDSAGEPLYDGMQPDEWMSQRFGISSTTQEETIDNSNINTEQSSGIFRSSLMWNEELQDISIFILYGLILLYIILKFIYLPFIHKYLKPYYKYIKYIIPIIFIITLLCYSSIGLHPDNENKVFKNFIGITKFSFEDIVNNNDLILKDVYSGCKYKYDCEITSAMDFYKGYSKVFINHSSYYCYINKKGRITKCKNT